jgi:hypothetical protein
MKIRFFYELVVGIIVLIAIFLFGEKGFAAVALLGAHPFIGKKKADERESQLFNKVGNYTAGTTLFACVLIYYFSDLKVNGLLIGQYWIGLVVAAFLMAHGASGLIIFREKH